MNLVEIAEQLNQKIRLSDLINSNHENTFIVLYKSSASREKLIKLINLFEASIFEDESVSVSKIATLAQSIVNSQCFIDGNHRTATALCYYINIVCNHSLFRIQPYMLYASIDFEYFKSIYSSETSIPFFSNNAIEEAILSRKNNCSISMNIALECFEEIIDKILNLAQFLKNLKIKLEEPHSDSITQQKQLFCKFAGYRPFFVHSTEMNALCYQIHLEQKSLLNNKFSI